MTPEDHPNAKRHAPMSMHVEVDASAQRLARIWSGVSERLESRRSGWWQWRRWAVRTAAAATLAAAVTAVFVLWQPAPAPSALAGAALETATDALSVELEDGSQLELAAHTKVKVQRSSATEVVIALNRGRVRCDVVPNRKRAFEVLASGVRVKVTGTHFSVDVSQGSRVTVSVQEGSVQVTPASGSDVKMLSAGESLTLDAPLRASDGARDDATTSGAAEAPAAAEDDTSTQARGGTDTPQAAPTLHPGGEQKPTDERAPRDDASDAPTKEPEASLTEEGSPTEEGSVPLDARQLFDQGNAARRRGDAAAAARAYEQLLANHPGDARSGLAAFELGRLRMDRLGDLHGAVAALRRAVTLAPGAGFKEDAMARLVDAYAAMGASDSCEKARKAYLDAFPSGVHAAAVAQKCGGH